MVTRSGTGAGRSTAIVLFTDLVRSTELRSRLGEEAAEVLRHRHDDLVTGVVEANRGRLVKHLGDGVMASFTGASDALAAAVGIQQALDRHNRSGASGVPLEVRIGVSAGDVAFEEADCFGTPVIEAARLCAAATGGQILVTDVVRLLAGTGGGYDLRPVGPLDLKGLPAPVSACEVAWEPLPAPFLPMPPLFTDIGRIFVGRGRELERLEQLWKEGAAGELRVAFLAGEPGVGKTRLAAELAREVHEEGATALAGRCDEDMGVPYQPFVEALRHFLDFTPDGDLPQRLGRYGGELTRLVPELTARLPELPPPLCSDPETERYRLFDGVAAWLAALSSDRPLLLVLDDLHWAAKPTLLLLRHVIRSSEPARLFVLATYRDTEVSRIHPLAELLADLAGQTGVERISLTGLDSTGVVAYMQRAAGHDLDEEDLRLAHAIHEETEGNAFFVREMLRHLTETGALSWRHGRWFMRLPVEELGIPEGVREVVGRRLSRLSAEANRVLRMAAVAGTEFGAFHVEEVGGVGESGFPLWFAEDALSLLPALEPHLTESQEWPLAALPPVHAMAQHIALHTRALRCEIGRVVVHPEAPCLSRIHAGADLGNNGQLDYGGLLLPRSPPQRERPGREGMFARWARPSLSPQMMRRPCDIQDGQRLRGTRTTSASSSGETATC
jgi:class 3 adenylate cyclase